MAPHTVRRHVTNYVIVLLLLFGLAVGFDRLLVNLGWLAIVGCRFRPILYLVLSRSVAVWLMTIGVLLLLFPKTRSNGVSLMVAGLLIDALPGLLEAHLKPLCEGR